MFDGEMCAYICAKVDKGKEKRTESVGEKSIPLRE